MKVNDDEVLSISNPRIISVIYFTSLAIIATLAFDFMIFLMGIVQLIPVYQSLLLAIVIAAPVSALFGKSIIHSTKPYWKHAFWSAFFMVLVAIPFYHLGFLYLFQNTHESAFTGTTFIDFLHMYWVTLTYAFVLLGIWLAILAGFAGVYLRAYLVTYLLQTLYIRRKTPHTSKDSVTQHQSGQYGETVSTDKKV